MQRFISIILRTTLLLTAFVACKRSDSARDVRTDASESVRIVSLSPAISRTLQDFDLEDQIVGRSQYCRLSDDSVPVVGDLLHIDYERLIRIDPTHIVVQPPSAGIDAELVELAREHDWAIGSWMLNTRDDIEDLVLELPTFLFAETSSAGREAALRGAELLNDLARALAPSSSDQWRGRVLLVEATDPVIVYGRGTYLHDLLTALGCTNATNGRLWPELSYEDVTKLNPEAMILVDTNVPATESAEPALGRLASLELTANREKCHAVLRHPDADLPSTALIEVATELREILRSFNTPDR